jgi:hypothetical protein
MVEVIDPLESFLSATTGSGEARLSVRADAALGLMLMDQGKGAVNMIVAARARLRTE